jgi:hypothetical protein
MEWIQMSNEVNIAELASGTLAAGTSVEWYLPRPNYDASKAKVAFFTIVPNPATPAGELTGNVDMEITRTWNTVWSNVHSGGTDHAFQRNVRLTNPAAPGGHASSYHLLVAETDN